MRERTTAGWALIVVLAALAAQGTAQQNDGPILYPNTQPKSSEQASLLVICDMACNWKLDGESEGRIEAGGSARLSVEVGQHVVVATTEDGMDRVQQGVLAEGKSQLVLSIELKPVREARLKQELEQQAQKRRELEQAAHEQELREQKERERAAQEEVVRQAKALYEDRQYVAAIPLLDKSCTAGSSDACEKLGLVYEEGKGVSKDYSQALALYSKACDAGNADGCNGLGTMYDVGRGVAKDDANAVALYTKACDAGSAEGCTDLGTMNLAGRGVDKQDYPTAIKLFSKACDAGSGNGCFYLGSMYSNGYGVGTDDSMALSLDVRACNAGSSCGCYMVGFYFRRGDYVKKDQKKYQQFLNKERSLGGCAIDELLKTW